ncbi:Uncharacterized protein K02A2.6 [Stylophora pistillata]|uniref:Uncharacterized protein K02A2.6 n=1 Tax=Stylophora pistillata TaxID=50429 RepID=A0A2B4SF19_STYPI|nr:Uncharacterized protein K02A2.6 [Stylophora pistillata]
MEAMGANSGSGQVNTVVDDGATGGHISSEQVNIVVSLRGSTSSEKRDCFNCGREDHLARDWRCPARGRKCLQCGEIGHFKVKCCKKLAKNSHLGHRQGATCNLLGQGAWEWFKSQKIQFQTRKEAKALFPYGSTKPLSTLGTFTADIMSIDTSVTCKADFVVINGDGRSLLCRETTVKLGLLRPGPSHAVNVVNTEADIKEKYKELFSGVGLLRDYELKLNIDDSVKPVAQRVRRIPFGVREKVERKLDELLENGIIEEVPEGPTGWVSPLVVIPKADGDIRICVDMRCANQAIVRERQPIPTIEEVLQDLYGSTVFSRVDLRWGFYQILLAEESRHVTKFVTHRGLYRYTRLMFGVTSAPEKYQQIIRDVLRGCEGVANIADDLIIHGRGEEQHDKRLLAVLDRLRETGLTLNKDKCEFILPRLKFFGLEVTQTGIEPSEEKVAEIRQAGPPQNVSEARSFHGLAQFVSKFVPDLSSIAERIQREFELETDQKPLEYIYSQKSKPSARVDRLLLRRSRLVIPRELRLRVLELAHEGHQGIVKTKCRLRSKVWWPKMDSDAEKLCRSCHGCQVVSEYAPPEPIARAFPPSGPWEDCAADILGPLPSGESLLVVVDYFSRYFEVVILRKWDRTPHNNSPVAAGQWEVERQNRTLMKSVQIAHIEGKDWRQELQTFLTAYRSTPQMTTGATPFYMMFGREMRSKLPDLLREAPITNEEVRDRDWSRKLSQKEYVDAKRIAVASEVEVGDKVLLKNSKTNKLSPNYDPNPSEVIDRKGGEILENSAAAIYADDTPISANVDYGSAPGTLNQVLQADVGKVAQWTTENKMVLNESKTKPMLVGGKRLHKKISSTSLTVHVNLVELGQVQSHKVLVVIIDTQLNCEAMPSRRSNQSVRSARPAPKNTAALPNRPELAAQSKKKKGKTTQPQQQASHEPLPLPPDQFEQLVSRVSQEVAKDTNQPSSFTTSSFTICPNKSATYITIIYVWCQ